jgi:hypothetical protein
MTGRLMSAAVFARGLLSLAAAHAPQMNAPTLTIESEEDSLAQGMVGEPYNTTLKANGGSGDYRWILVNPASMPPNLRLEATTGTISGVPDRRSEGRKSITVQVSDGTTTARRTFFLTINRRRRWLFLSRMGNLTLWVGILALYAPILGAVWILVYAFTTPGTPGSYLSVGMLTALAALLIGVLIGFLFGIPRFISSGQARPQQSFRYTPSSNLTEVSDWLTKLLLGAGLVQLTHLGTPIGKLINHIAAALYTLPADRGSAQVMAGAIIAGYTAIGVLGGYVLTTMWYQEKLTQQSLSAD